MDNEESRDLDHNAITLPNITDCSYRPTTTVGEEEYIIGTQKSRDEEINDKLNKPIETGQDNEDEYNNHD